MAHLNFATDINEIVKMDGPIQNGPMMRWQRKAQESGATGGLSPNRSRCKTPGKSGPGSTGSNSKTPKTPGMGSQEDRASNAARSAKKTKTPGQKTPGRNTDRFIPNRPATDMEYSHFALTSKQRGEGEDEDHGDDENMHSQEYKRHLQDAMVANDKKILNFNVKAPESASTMNSNLHVLYSCSKSSTKQAASARHIPKVPDRVMDAPALMDDYYLNLLDWSSTNLLSVVLNTTVFMWNADTGGIEQLVEITEPDQYVSSLCSVPDSPVMAVGLSNGSVQLWNMDQKKLIRTMSGHPARVGSLSWNSHVLSSGCRTGAIHHHDVRVAQHQIGVLSGHTQEVCGLKWSPDGRHLASGGNDNLVNVWGPPGGEATPAPVYTFSQHQAAVKAISWCPWKPSLLATGGGTADRHIRLWNVQNGSSVGAHDTQSQVCSILWSPEHKELISGHGYALNHIRIWKYPTMAKVADLVGHQARVLSMAMSPDGTTVASAAADETIRLWKCFAVDPKHAKKDGAESAAPLKSKKSGINMCIR